MKDGLNRLLNMSLHEKRALTLNFTRMVIPASLPPLPLYLSGFLLCHVLYTMRSLGLVLTDSFEKDNGTDYTYTTLYYTEYLLALRPQAPNPGVGRPLNIHHIHFNSGRVIS